MLGTGSSLAALLGSLLATAGPADRRTPCRPPR